MPSFLVGGLSADETARLLRIERKLDAVLNHLGVTFEDRSGLSAEARRHADSGQKIMAIKQHRDDTGARLAEAKAAVEEYLRRD